MRELKMYDEGSYNIGNTPCAVIGESHETSLGNTPCAVIGESHEISLHGHHGHPALWLVNPT